MYHVLCLFNVVLLPSFAKTVENGYTWLIWLTRGHQVIHKEDGWTHAVCMNHKPTKL